MKSNSLKGFCTVCQKGISEMIELFPNSNSAETRQSTSLQKEMRLIAFSVDNIE